MSLLAYVGCLFSGHFWLERDRYDPSTQDEYGNHRLPGVFRELRCARCGVHHEDSPLSFRAYPDPLATPEPTRIGSPLPRWPE